MLRLHNLRLRISVLLLLLLVEGSGAAYSQIPTIVSFSPPSGPIGTAVTITGTNFNTTSSNNVVFFGGVQGAVTSASTSQLLVTVPVGASFAPISVTVGGSTAFSSSPFVVTFSGGSSISSLSFSSGIEFITRTRPYGVAVADLNGDGKPDLVVADNKDSLVSIFQNTSSTGAISLSSFAGRVDLIGAVNPWGVAIGDLDGDGKPDIVVTDGTSGAISVFRNTNSGGVITGSSFAANVDFTTGGSGYGIALGDIDGDGKPDIVVANRFANSISILRNTSSPGSITGSSFATNVDFVTESTPYGIAISDIDGDGKPDIVVANYGVAALSIYRNTSTTGTITNASLAARVDLTPAGTPIGVVAGDLDGDGKPDLVTANIDSTISVFRNISTSGSITSGSFALRVDLPLSGSPNALALGGLDGDVKPDIVVTNGNNPTISIIKNLSTSGVITTGSFAPKVNFATTGTPYGVAVCDLDGDGKPDIAVTNSDSNSVSVYRSVVGVPAAPQVISALPGNARVVLQWGAIVEPDFLRYRIYISTSPNASTLTDSTIHGITDTKRSVQGLTNGTKYYFRVTAVDSSGNESLFSNELSATPGQGTLSLVPVLDFGSLVKADSTTRTFFARNPSPDIVVITLTSTGVSSFASLLTTPDTLNPGDSVAVSVRFKPTSFGIFGDSLFVFSDAGVGRVWLSAFAYSKPGKPLQTTVNPNTWSNTSTFTVGWTNSQTSGLPISRIWYALDTVPSALNEKSQTAVSNAADVSVTVVGRHTLNFYLEDTLSNKNRDSIGSAQILFDNIGPSITQNNAALDTILIQSNGTASASPPIVASAVEPANESGAKSLKLLYRRLDEQSWKSLNFVGASSASLTIPDSAFVKDGTFRGVVYQIQATDTAGNSALSPLLSFEAQYASDLSLNYFTTIPTITSLGLPDAQRVKAYRIFSIPYDLSNPRPSGIIEQSFGAHSDKGVPYVRWRMDRIVNDLWNDYDAFKDSSLIVPGSAFFLISKGEGNAVNVNKPKFVRADKMLYTGVKLSTGWNLIGNPFLVDVPFDHLIFETGRHPTLYYYSGTGLHGGWDLIDSTADTLRTWQGWAVKMDSASTLRFNPAGVQFPSNVKNKLPNPSAAHSSNDPRHSAEWTLQIDAHRDDIGMSCVGTEVGMMADAAQGYDAHDRFQAPFVGNRNVMLDLSSDQGPLMKDIRPLNQDGGTWELTLVTGDPFAAVTLTVGSMEKIRAQKFAACLVDVAKGLVYDLDRQTSVQAISGKDGKEDYRVIVGTNSFIMKNLNGLALLPSDPQLYHNYPNPFNPETVIRYAVPNSDKRTRVLLKVFNVLGQEVATVVNQDESSGFYEVSFNGSNCSTGVYFYRISMTRDDLKFQETKKMLLIR